MARSPKGRRNQQLQPAGPPGRLRSSSAAPAGITGTGAAASTRTICPSGQWFAHYASHFRTVELNAPFYSWPTVATVKTWLRQAGRRRFVYTVKVCELITHVKRFAGTRELVRDFGLIADLLGAAHGLLPLPAAAELPLHAGPLEAHRRRSSTRPDGTSSSSATGAGGTSGCMPPSATPGSIFCSCSGPRLPDELVKTADDVYVRFHGTTRWYRHDYTKDELAVWAERIRASGAKRVWAYFNNDREGLRDQERAGADAAVEGEGIGVLLVTCYWLLVGP